MGTISIADCCEVIGAALGKDVPVVQFNETLTEGVNVTPMLKVYPMSGGNVSSPDKTMHRASFAGPNRNAVRIHEWDILADLYVRPRSDIAEEIMLSSEMIDNMIEQLDDAIYQPFFGLDGIHGVAYEWDRVTLVSGQQNFAGLRFTITLTVY